jgi:hypothetical protein
MRMTFVQPMRWIILLLPAWIAQAGAQTNAEACKERADGPAFVVPEHDVAIDDASTSEQILQGLRAANLRPRDLMERERVVRHVCMLGARRYEEAVPFLAAVLEQEPSRTLLGVEIESALARIGTLPALRVLLARLQAVRVRPETFDSRIEADFLSRSLDAQISGFKHDTDDEHIRFAIAAMRAAPREDKSTNLDWSDKIALRLLGLRSQAAACGVLQHVADLRSVRSPTQPVNEIRRDLDELVNFPADVRFDCAPFVEEFLRDAATDEWLLSVEGSLVRRATPDAVRMLIQRLRVITARPPDPDGHLQLRRIVAGLTKLPPETPIDAEALRIALPGSALDDTDKHELLKFKGYRRMTSLPWSAAPVQLSRNECEATRSLSRRFDSEMTRCAERNAAAAAGEACKLPGALPGAGNPACYGLAHMDDQVLDACLQYPIDFNLVCTGYPGGLYPLEEAARYVDEHAVNALLDHGADPRRGHVIPYLVSSCATSPELFADCERMLRRFVKLGADINDRYGNGSGGPPTGNGIHFSSRSASRALTLLQLELGADINSAGPDTCTAFDEAVLTQSEHEAAFLRAHGGRASTVCRTIVGLRKARNAVDALLGGGVSP